MLFLMTALIAGLITPLTSLAGLLLLAGAAAVLARNRAAWGGAGGGIILLGWLFWLPLSMTWSLSPGVALVYISVLLCLPFAWLIAVAARDRAASLLDWLLPLALAGMILWTVLQGPDTFTSKPQGPFNDPNAFAAFLNLLLLPCLARWLAADLAAQAPLWRSIQLALLAGALFSAFLISSRGGMLVLLLATGLLLWRARGVPHAARRAGVLLAVALAAFAAAFHATGGLNVAQRLASTVTQGDAARINLMKSALSMIADHPWLGTGIGSFQLLYARYRAPGETTTAGGWVHNDYLQLWQEAGLPMFLLLLALLLWVLRRGWLLLNSGDPSHITPLGYLLAVLAVLLHASVNFLLYFAPISLLAGAYLGLIAAPGRPSSPGTDPAGGGLAATPSATAMGSRHRRAYRLIGMGYVLIVGYLLLGQVAVEYLLGDRQYGLRLSSKLDLHYPRSEVAYWLSVLAPFNPVPHQVLAFDTADAMTLSGGGLDMLDEALSRMETSMRLVPCYQPFVNAALSMLVLSKEQPDADLLARGERIARQSLACGPRHGLTYYYAGVLDSLQPGRDPLQKWIKGLTMTNDYGEQLLLATSIMITTQPEQKKTLAPLARQMAQDLQLRESRPGVQPDQYFWVEAHRRLQLCCGTQYQAILNAARHIVVVPEPGMGESEKQ